MNKRKLSAMIISFVLVIAMTLSCAPALAEDAGEEPAGGMVTFNPFVEGDSYIPVRSLVFEHIETCGEDCADGNCKCPCHLFKRLMGCETLEEIFTIIDSSSEEELNSLSEDLVAQIEEYVEFLSPDPLPPIEESEPPVESEIYYPTANYTSVAPLDIPVTGDN